MSPHAQLFLPIAPYILVRDGTPLALAIANRHYSRQWRGNLEQSRFLPPGKRMILLHPLGLWIFVWVQQQYRSDGQTGVNCCLFRNESNILSSHIILMAEQAWCQQYGITRMFTYVHPKKIKSTNPGYCFQKAGWTKTHHLSSRGCILLVKEPANS